MMFYYEIAHGSHDGGDSIILMRGSKISRDDLIKWIGDAIVDILALYEKKGTKRGQYPYPRSVEYILNDIADWLVMNRGFKHIQVEEIWSVNSFASLFDKTDHRKYGPNLPDEELEPITDRLNALGYSRKDDWMLVDDERAAERENIK